MTSRRSAWKVGAALAVLAMVAVACGNSGGSDGTRAGGATTTSAAGGGTAVSLTGVPGVTDDAIDFVVVGTKSNNPLGTCVLDCYAQGIKAYFDYRNSQGGIYGRKLVVAAQLDDELSKNQQRALEIVDSKKWFADFNATLLASGWEDLAKADIPTYAWGINFKEATGHPNIFMSVGTQCGSCTGRTVPYAASLVKAKRIATLGYGISENSKVCATTTGKSIEMYAGETGEKVVYVNDDLAYGLPNGIGPEVTAMKKAGVDFISTCIDLNGMKTLAQELQRQGMDDVILYHPNTYNQSFVKDAGALFEGDIVSVSFRPFEATPSGGLKQYLAWMKKAGNPLTELAMVGWLNADLAYTGLKAAGPNFDRAKVIAATNEITDYSADGLLNPIDWSRQHNPPTQDDPTTNGYVKECSSLVRVVKGEFEVVGDASKPFICWSNANRDWAEPTHENFG
jgi:ABC-type branched-subunit amino acid transport system substrate-binding protein